MKDISPVLHSIAAVGVQLSIGFIFGMWLVGGVLGCLWFIAREHTQAEYRWISTFGKGKRFNMPWWGGFDYRVWSKDSSLDLILPVIACLLVYTIKCFLGV